MEEKKDPLSEEMFQPKRRNQKFANEKNKADFNNKKAREEREVFKEIDSINTKNYRILKKLLDDKTELEISRHSLEVMGFDFQTFNHFKRIVMDGIKRQFLGVYDYLYAYMDEEKSKLLIIKYTKDVIYE